MKMRIVATAILAALASRVALAASEGGDTWSELQPIQRSTYSSLRSTPRVDAANPARDAPFEGSEGGDTWSSVQALGKTSDHENNAPVVATTASLATLQREHPAAYGTPVTDASAVRTVRLGPGSHWVNVGYGESVRFIIAPDGDGPERSFAWRFDVSPAMNYVDLSDLTPANILDHNVRVFVAPNPLYRGG